MRRFLIIFFFAFIYANLIALDVWVVLHSRVPAPAVLSGDAAQVAKNAEPMSKPCDFSCPKACIDKINEATAGAKTEKTAETPAVQTVTVIITPSATQLREYYVALGTGTGEGEDWKDVENSEMKVDLSQFNQVKNVYFEVAASLRNDNVVGNVRLYNYTDKRPVWNSEVTINKLKCQTATSVPISVPLASKTYRLQVKATLNATVYIDQARLRIVTE